MSTEIIRRPWADLATASLGGATPHIVQSISRARGPVVKVLIEPSTADAEEMRRAGKLPHAPIPAVLAIDTGAHSTVLHGAILRQLQLTRIIAHGSIDPGYGLDMIVPCKQYLVNLLIPQTGGVVLRAENYPVLDAYVPHARHPVDGLLGRDLLANARFAYSGPDSWFAISFIGDPPASS